MFIFLSKFLPLFLYPAGLVGFLIVLGLLFRNRKRLQNVVLVCAFLILWLGGNRWISYWLASSLEWQYLPLKNIPTTDAIVVLGGGTEPAQFPRSTVELNSAGNRVIYAADLYKQGKAPNILLSGGSINLLDNRGTSTPATEMANVLEMIGVPDSALWLQTASQNTHEDAVFSLDLLKQKGVKRILLVTSALHMPRAMALFRNHGVEVIPAPTDYAVTQTGWDDLKTLNVQSILINLVPNSSSISLTSDVLKEYIGIFVYHLEGWL
ncbi:MAG TPA: YdcF family protein [Anaerolineaceae bacterium]|nr:YdcF family protein [Anaerolineaceae bacterium]